MKAQTLTFTAPRRVEIVERKIPPPGAEDVLVQTIVSAVSPGSEMLVYRGQCPQVRDSRDPFSSDITYPTAYGYACVGRVLEAGKSVNRDLVGKMVFAFQPHTSHFILHPSALIPIPEGIAT
jgi:NADPH:quinone reductase-like Zn-dependent oxidoreductase